MTSPRAKRDPRSNEFIPSGEFPALNLSFFLRPGTITLQALSEANRRLWMEAMDGKEPVSLSETLGKS